MTVQTWQAGLGLLIALLGGGGLAALFRVGARNQLDRSNSAVALAEAYGKLIDQLEARIVTLEKRVASLERENAKLKSGIRTLAAPDHPS